jgi:5-methylcytosine-specific restriction endonuclease McrA
VTVRRLEDDVDCALAVETFDPFALDAAGGGDLQAGALSTAGERTPPRERTSPFRLFGVPRDVARLLRAALALAQRRIEAIAGRNASQSEAFEAMLAHALAEWMRHPPGSRPASRERLVFERDGWRCAVPGCSSYANLHAHHLAFRSAGGSDEPSNLVTLCAFHHLRGVHAGRVRIRGLAPCRLRFELGVRTGCAPLAVYGSGDRVVG